MKGRAPVKAELASRGIISWDSAYCAFCQDEPETIWHLFFGCKIAWFVWSWCCATWGIYWATPGNTVTFLYSWHNIPFIRGDRQVWCMLFFVVIWSIWLFRNEVVFQGKNVDLTQMVQLIKLRLAHWIDAKWPDHPQEFLDIYRFPNEAVIKRSTMRKPCNQRWQFPEEGTLKFNVDGASKGKPGATGIGGILRDHRGNTKVIFSRSIGFAESNEAELTAIKEAFIVFVASRWLASYNLIIETDSNNAKCWVDKPEIALWRLRKIILQMEVLKRKLLNWRIEKVPREIDEDADKLAKAGVERASDLLVIHE